MNVFRTFPRSAVLFCLAFLLAYTWNVNIPVHRDILSQALGAVVLLAWVAQVPLVVWTLARLGQSHRIPEEAGVPTTIA